MTNKMIIDESDKQEFLKVVLEGNSKWIDCVMKRWKSRNIAYKEL